jgi:threonine dehydratase
MSAPSTLADAFVARRRIAGHVVRTPLERSASLSARLGAEVLLKLEHRQTTGSFKLRGATNALLALDAEARHRGVVAASSGNHGRALAHAARAAGARCTICVSGLAPANKRAAIEALGAKLHVVGRSHDETQAEVERLVARDGLIEISPFDDPQVIAGQATLGLEILEDAPDARTILVPLSGGGLAAGVALAAKAIKPVIRIVGVSMEHGAAMHASLAAGRPVPVEEVPTLADALGGGIGLANRHSFALVAALLDEAVLLTEAEIAAGIRHAYAEEREIVEGGGVVGIAALLAGKIRPAGVTVALLSGRNIDIATHRAVINGADELPAT